MLSKKILITCAILGTLSFSCSKFSRISKSRDINEKYDAALNYYDNKQFYKASVLFEDIMGAFVGAAEYEKIQFYYAYSQYEQQQYLIASHHFKSFFETYNRSPFAEEALFMNGYSLYKDTPDYNLDQSGTDAAIEELQNFINRYPTSQYAEQCDDLINELRARLELKAFEVSKQYSHLRYYKAAAIAYENFMKDYPDSDYKPEAMYKKMEAEYELAKMSVFNKQEERYNDALKTYKKFGERYSDSGAYEDAKKLKVSVDKDLKKHMQKKAAWEKQKAKIEAEAKAGKISKEEAEKLEKEGPKEGRRSKRKRGKNLEQIQDQKNDD
ncbi:outer membrane protein assembly factor BamD [Flammeovirga kamogawensis]|uniref:Outer membrane protein assembly factor BamD n=1 Tax=Flammeovirga kamogawensis TaxID=373891 RepID=A0ABX8GVS7_9BACT|nr:outer membrane protein assembly factor BamD [Flammeovirga kamogawensis]MBB6461565.1 outer membrane protein assembly factor BamD [Flammeovirga kamogawensis]QWG07503.1 outer membrane protein assembly factor BamD [Flammeovirga kamogawensis]TRX69316.1 outer membrane protein assembly factor BamD [Flammeovirga kamogawensis]